MKRSGFILSVVIAAAAAAAPAVVAQEVDMAPREAEVLQAVWSHSHADGQPLDCYQTAVGANFVSRMRSAA